MLLLLLLPLLIACCCWVPRAKSLELSTSRAKSPPSPLLSRKKDKSTEKRERVSQEGEAKFIRVQKKIFWYFIFRRKNSSLQCWVFCVSFFLSGGRLLNKNISNDIWASFHPLLNLVFSLKLFILELSRLFSSLVWTYFSVCVWIAWCWTYQPCVCV